MKIRRTILSKKSAFNHLLSNKLYTRPATTKTPISKNLQTQYMPAFTCAPCGVTFNDSLSHGMHLLSRKHLEKVGQVKGSEHATNSEYTIKDLRMLIERKRAEKEIALFGAAKKSADDHHQNQKEGSGAAVRRGREKNYFGTLSRDPGPHDEVVAEMKR